MADHVEQDIELYETLKGDRGVWEDHWQRLGELMLPKRADFTVTEEPGSRRQGGTVRYDGTPLLGARNLASAIDGLIKPKSEQWFNVLTEDPLLNETDEVKAWLADTEERMFRAMYSRRARFLQATGEVDLDLVVFGTGVLFTGVNKFLDKLLFKSFHLKNSYIQRNSEGDVDTIFIRQMFSARQAVQEFGRERVSDVIRKALEENEPFKDFEFVWKVSPRDERDPRSLRSDQKPFASKWIEVKEVKEVAASGFQNFPFQVPTWDNAADEDYGRSPGMIALADSNTANSMGRTLLRAAEKVVDPPLMIGHDSVIGRVQQFAGGINYFDMQSAKQLGRIPIEALNTRGNIPVGREMQNDTREQIWQAFFRNILQLPVDRPQMTATEILERKEEFIRTIGPVFGRLESDYTGAIVDSVFDIMAQAGEQNPTSALRLAEAPDAIKGAGLRFEYTSPVQQAREQIQAAAAARSAEVLQPYVLADPQLMDNFDGDQISRDVGRASGMPPRWLRPVEIRDQIREGRNAQAEEQKQQQEAMLAVDAGSKAAQSGLLQQGANLLQGEQPEAPER
jgi:hypothetical protein